MRIVQTQTETVVKFSASEVAQFSPLPAKCCYISYDAAGRYENNSAWLDKSAGWESAIDRLIALADTSIATLH